MNVNDKIMQTLELFKNATLIEVTPLAYRKIREDILSQIEKRNIKLVITEKVKEYKVYTHKIDCFAYKDKVCDALKEIDCVGCKFYKNKKVFL